MSLHEKETIEDTLVSTFREKGWVGPFPLLESGQCDLLIDTARAASARCLPPSAMDPSNCRSNFQVLRWFKSLHEVHPLFFDLASHPKIVQIITRLIGKDVLAWGVSMKRVCAGGGHRWHVDAEQTRCDGLTLFLGLRNVSVDSTLKVISGSHRISATPQTLKLESDEIILNYCRDHARECRLEVVDPGNGGFFIMNGRLWHGSRNTSSRHRDAMILQYCAPDQKVRIPLTFDEPIVWSDEPPGCALVTGIDAFHINRLISRPYMR